MNRDDKACCAGLVLALILLGMCGLAMFGACCRASYWHRFAWVGVVLGGAVAIAGSAAAGAILWEGMTCE